LHGDDAKSGTNQVSQTFRRPISDAHGSANTIPAQGEHDHARPELHAPERATTAHGTALPKRHAPIPPATAAATAPMSAPATTRVSEAHNSATAIPARSAHEHARPKLHAPERAPTGRGANLPKRHAPIPNPAASIPPPDLPNRAARRRWARQQRRLRHAPPGATRP